MLNRFINEYKERFIHHFSSGALGEFERFASVATEPRFYPSIELKERLKWLKSQFYEAPAVAVVGQFSSGKSSVLNAILDKNILPTGAVPVTAKATMIKYGPNPALKVQYINGKEELLEVGELARFVDQRGSLEGVERIVIYEPNELLKKISFIDTPGLNSRSDADTKATKMALSEAHAVLWVSLIDNAARKSELDELDELPKGVKAICALNQADKLNSDEINKVLTHAKTTYKNRFDAVLAVSAKRYMEQKSSVNSGALSGDGVNEFGEIYDFLDIVSQNKEQFIKLECAKIRASLIRQFEKYAEVLGELDGIFSAFEADLDIKISKIKAEFEPKFALFFEQIKQNANLVATQINESLKRQKYSYFTPKNGLLGGWQKVEYERIFLDSDEALNRLIYNDERLAKAFLKWRRSFNEMQSELLAAISAVVNEVSEAAIRFGSRYERVRRSESWHSKGVSAKLGQFAAEVEARFVSGFERELAKSSAKSGLFFEKIGIKIAQNYQNAVKLSVGFLADKIERAAKDYESDPAAFGLYFPQQSEINSRVLTDLSYYEFEGDFVGNGAWVGRFLAQFKEGLMAVAKQNREYIRGVLSAAKSDIAILNQPSSDTNKEIKCKKQRF